MSSSQPRIIVDSCFGGKRFAEYLRYKGFEVSTINEAFGRSDVTDVDWIKAVGVNNWIAFTKDKSIRRRIAEKTAVEEHNARLVCLIHPEISFEEQVKVFEKHWETIEKQFNVEGPWILSVSYSSVVVL